MDQFTSTLVRMEKRLAQVPWLSGQAFGLADIIVLPLVDRMDDLSFASMWENGFPLVTDWFTRAKQRPSFETAFYPKARLSEFLTISPLRV